MSGPWAGGDQGLRAHCILAPNPGPMTLDGTNTWVLREPGSRFAVVVDPGPLDEIHLRRVAEYVESLGVTVLYTLLTHGHPDHAEGAARFAQLTGSTVRAAGRGHGDLCDGFRMVVDGLELAVVATPGHSSDSLSFLVPADNALLTGDTVLGRGTTVVAWPDGQLGAYLDSLERLARLSADGQVVNLLPGHGPTLPDAASVLRYYLDHRQERLAQVRAAVEAGDRTAQQVVARVYADVPREVWPAAEKSVKAQLDYLGFAVDAGG